VYTAKWLSVSGRDRSNDGCENRRIIGQVPKNYTVRNTDKIVYYVTYECYRIGRYSKKKFNVNYTLHTT
jgi:hypothetical protein